MSGSVLISARSRHTPLSKVKVVITGQDPYHNDNQAHGLSFSVRPPTRAPPSLKNMYTVLKSDYPSFKPPPNNGGLLTPWAEQGVLMLNACLTVRAHTAASHRGKGWEKFTQKVIDTVAKMRTRGVVFLAWGADAQKTCKGLGTSGKHLVLESVHPSPLSASRGFFQCRHFKKTNDWLSSRYGEDGIIDWNLSTPTPIAAPKVAGPVKVAGSEKQSPVAGSAVAKSESGPEEKAKAEKADEDEYVIVDFEEDEAALEVMEELARAEDAGKLKLEELGKGKK